MHDASFVFLIGVLTGTIFGSVVTGIMLKRRFREQIKAVLANSRRTRHVGLSKIDKDKKTPYKPRPDLRAEILEIYPNVTIFAEEHGLKAGSINNKLAGYSKLTKADTRQIRELLNKKLDRLTTPDDETPENVESEQGDMLQ